jgi:hypothetical protein
VAPNVYQIGHHSMSAIDTTVVNKVLRLLIEDRLRMIPEVTLKNDRIVNASQALIPTEENEKMSTGRPEIHKWHRQSTHNEHNFS